MTPPDVVNVPLPVLSPVPVPDVPAIVRVPPEAASVAPPLIVTAVPLAVSPVTVPLPETVPVIETVDPVGLPMEAALASDSVPDAPTVTPLVAVSLWVKASVPADTVVVPE